MATLAEMRAKLLAAEKTKGGNGGRDNAIYAHWQIPDNATAKIRFLPDGDEGNDFFWRERQMIKIPFSGVKGGDEQKKVLVQVPCVEMWDGMECPVHAEIRPWFKDPSMEDTARKYWKKRSYLFQGLVVDSPMVEEEVPANLIRRFTISPQIFKLISKALMDPDFGENLPTDYDGGVDFQIEKTQQGQYADYGTSSWARRERSLNQEERDAITEHGLFNLNDFMPKKPNERELQAIFELFESSVEGDLYDPARFGEFYRPWGLDMPKGDSGASTAKASTPKAEEAKVETPANVEAETPATNDSAETPTAKPDATDILAKIKARKAQA